MNKYTASINNNEVDLQELVLEYIDNLLHTMKADLTCIRRNWSELSISPHTAFSMTIDYVENVRLSIQFDNLTSGEDSEKQEFQKPIN